MKKSFVIIMLSLVFLTAFKKKELFYTDTEKELISQICKEDQACKDEINQKFKGLEFTEGELEYQRKMRKEYLKGKIPLALSEREIIKINKVCEGEKKTSNDIASYDACVSEFTKKLLSFSGSYEDIHGQRIMFLRNYSEGRSLDRLFGKQK